MFAWSFLILNLSCSCYWSWRKRGQIPGRNPLMVVQESNISVLLCLAPGCRDEAPILWPVSWLPWALLTICQHSSLVVCCSSAKQVPWPPHQPAALLQEGRGAGVRASSPANSRSAGEGIKKSLDASLLTPVRAKSTGRNDQSPAFSAFSTVTPVF